jgi:hypothetical protein
MLFLDSKILWKFATKHRFIKYKFIDVQTLHMVLVVPLCCDHSNLIF